MAANSNWKEYLLKISILGHPDKLVSPLIHKLILSYPSQATLHNTSSVSEKTTENTYILQLELQSWRLTIYLVQPLGQHLIDKLQSHYYTAIAGSIVIFSNNDPESFEAAKNFYSQIRQVNGNLPVLITFIEVLGSRIPVIDEPETLNRESQVSYYGIREHDEAAFSKIIEAFIGNYFGI